MSKFRCLRTFNSVVARRRSGPPRGVVFAQLLSGGGVFLPFGGAADGLLKARGFLRRSASGARRFQDRFCVPVHEVGEQAPSFRRYIVCKLPGIHIRSVSSALKAKERAGALQGERRVSEVTVALVGVRRRVGLAGPTVHDGGPARAGGSKGCAPAQGRDEGPTAQEGEERECFLCRRSDRGPNMAE